MTAAAKLLAAVERSPRATAAHDRAGSVGLFTEDGCVEDPVGSGSHVGHAQLGRFYDTFIGPRQITFHRDLDIVTGTSVIRDLTLEVNMGADARLMVPTFIRYDLREGVPIVPVASVGGQETALFLNRAQWLAKLLMADRLPRLKSVPISLALPWGLNISDLAGHIPLPAKIAIEVQDLIETDGDDRAVHDKVMQSLQAAVDRLAAERRFPVIG